MEPRTDNDGIKPLFRLDAIKLRRDRQYGEPLRLPAVKANFVLVGIVSALAIMTAFFCFFQVGRKVEVHGTLALPGGLPKVVSPQVGVIKEVIALEGMHVSKGDRLFRVGNDRAGNNVNSAQAAVADILRQRKSVLIKELAVLKTQLLAKSTLEKRRSAELKNEAEYLTAQIEMQTQRSDIAKDTVRKYKELLGTEYVSRTQLQAKEDLLLNSQQRMAELKRTHVALVRESHDAAAAAEDKLFELERQQASINKQLFDIQEKLALSEISSDWWILASQDGLVTGITGFSGQAVTNGTTLATIVPTVSMLIGELQVPSSIVSYLKPGLAVALRYSAFPYQRFGQFQAYIYEISGTPVVDDDARMTSANQVAEKTYRIRVRILDQNVIVNGVSVALKPGMTFDTSILLEKRTLAEWIFEPILKMARKH